MASNRGRELWICHVPTWLLAAELRDCAACKYTARSNFLPSIIWLTQGPVSPSKTPRPVDHWNGQRLWCGHCLIRSIASTKSFQHLYTVQAHLEFCLDPGHVFSEALAFICHFPGLRRETLWGLLVYLRWDRSSRIPEIQRSVEGIEKGDPTPLVTFCSQTDKEEIVLCPDFSNCCDTQTPLITYFSPCVFTPGPGFFTWIALHWLWTLKHRKISAVIFQGLP